MSQPSKALELWFKWKSLRLPWRRKWLCGLDLNGNQFYEHHAPNSPGRPRRIVHYARATHPSEAILTPAWLQWLRHTRPAAPSIDEQRYEVSRQGNLKQLVAAADARWAAKPTYLDAPEEMAQPRPLMEPRDQGGYNDSVKEGNDPGVLSPVASAAEMAEGRVGEGERIRKEKEDPWKTAQQGAPGEAWKPKEWTPGNMGRR